MYIGVLSSVTCDVCEDMGIAPQPQEGEFTGMIDSGK